MDSPTWMYHAQHGARLFNDEGEFASAGSGWVDTPAKLTQAPGADDGKADDEPLDREALKARAKELGISFPKNVNTEKLAELVAAADKGE